MHIIDGFVVCQDNGDWTSPICKHESLDAAVAWLLGFWTHEDGTVDAKYDQENYKIEEWIGGKAMYWAWRVEPSGGIIRV